MRVVVLGAGSLGSLVGGALARTDADVTLLGRANEHLERVASDGLAVTGPDGSTETVRVATATDPKTVADGDAVVICVKSYDTAAAAADIEPHLGDADVVTLQNGLGNAEAIAERVDEERVVVGTTTHGAVLEAPGHVRHAGTGDTTIGRYAGGDNERVREFAALLSRAGIETTVTNDPARAVWTKVLVNAGINAATALARAPNGALVDSEAGERVLRRGVEEGVAVARAEGVSVPDDVVERTREVARETASNRSSMRQDLERGSRTEIEALNGELARRASQHGVDAPVNETLADLVRVAESQ